MSLTLSLWVSQKIFAPLAQKVKQPQVVTKQKKLQAEPGLSRDHREPGLAGPKLSPGATTEFCPHLAPWEDLALGSSWILSPQCSANRAIHGIPQLRATSEPERLSRAKAPACPEDALGGAITQLYLWNLSAVSSRFNSV